MADANRPLVVVTGSTGFIGKRLVEALTDRYRLVGLDRNRPPPRSPGGFKWLECDLTCDESVTAAFEHVRASFGERIASVLHLAAYYDFSGRPSPLYKELTVEGTRRVLQAMQRFTVEQFVFSSSILVLKPVEGGGRPLTEASPVEPAWDYPRSKVEAEKVVAEQRGGIPALVLRIAGVYDDQCHSIPIAQQIRRIHERSFDSYFFPGDASHGQPFVHVEDLVDCFRRAVDERCRRSGGEELLLVAEADLMSYAELQDQIGELIHGKEWPTIRIPAAVAKAGAWVKDKVTDDEAFIKPWMIDLADDHYPVAIRRAHERLGWTPRRRLRDTLPAMIAELKRDPRRWYEANNLKYPDRRELVHPAGVSEKKG
jgi:nucleoside-diphosphate-sugar epimerase